MIFRRILLNFVFCQHIFISFVTIKDLHNMMKKCDRRKYGKPQMVMEKFVPNEFVAGCLLQSRIMYHDGVVCFDKNHDGFYQGGEGDGVSSSYTGFVDEIAAGNFDVLGRERLIKDGAPGYLFVGSGSFDWNMYPHQLDGTVSTYYNYNGSNFIPCYQAKILVHCTYSDEITYMYLGDDGSGPTTNAS